MKAQQVIENYCRLYRVNPPEVNNQEKRYFVTISPDGSDIFYLRESSRLQGQIIGAAMKRGFVLYVSYGNVMPVTWENWKFFWKVMFAPKVRNRAPEPNYTRPYKSEMFEEAQQARVYKKPQKRGSERTFVANMSMNMFTPAKISTVKI